MIYFFKNSFIKICFPHEIKSTEKKKIVFKVTNVIEKMVVTWLSRVSFDPLIWCQFFCLNHTFNHQNVINIWHTQAKKLP